MHEIIAVSCAFMLKLPMSTDSATYYYYSKRQETMRHQFRDWAAKDNYAFLSAALYYFIQIKRKRESFADK